MATDPTLKSAVLEVRAGLAALAAAHDDAQRRYLADLLCRDTARLVEQCSARNAWLDRAYDWIEAHGDELETDTLKAREDRWLLSLRQYEVAMDLLGQVLEAMKAIPDAADPRGNKRGTVPHIQEAFL